MFLKKFILVFLVLGLFALNAQGTLDYQEKKYILKQVCNNFSKDLTCQCTNLKINVSSLYKGDEFELGLNSVMIGNFSSSKHLEAIIHTYGCEPHVSNDGGYMVYKKKWEWKMEV